MVFCRSHPLMRNVARKVRSQNWQSHARSGVNFFYHIWRGTLYMSHVIHVIIDSTTWWSLKIKSAFLHYHIERSVHKAPCMLSKHTEQRYFCWADFKNFTFVQLVKTEASHKQSHSSANVSLISIGTSIFCLLVETGKSFGNVLHMKHKNVKFLQSCICHVPGVPLFEAHSLFFEIVLWGSK